MIRHIVVVFFLSGAVAFGLSSCTSSTGPGTMTTITKVIDTSGLPFGSVKGHVRLLDSLYSTRNSSGAIASLDGTTIQAVTDSNGAYAISNIPAGTYTLTISKNGFGSCKFYNITTIGPAATVVAPIILSQSPIASFNLDSIVGGDTINQRYFTVKGTAPDIFSYGVIIYVDLDSTVQLNDNHFSQFEGSEEFGLGIAAQGSIPTSLFLPSGTKLYLTAAFFNKNSDVSVDPSRMSSGYYYDPLNDASHCISMGPRSNVLTVIVK